MDYIGEDNVDTLKAMGFTDDNEVRHALRLAKNDLSEAVSLLTRETSGLDARMTESNNSSVPLPSTSPTDAAQFAASTDTTDDSGPLPDSLEFPTTHLYELESRVLTSSWNVPFGPKESLARCLHAARCLAREKLCEGDDGCNRFMGNVLVEAFNKLLNSAEVQNRWNKETLDGILLMHLSLVAFVVERLAYLPIPINLLKIIAQLFDPNSNYMQKTKLRYFQRDKWEEAFGSTENAYAVPRCDDSTPEYGFLLEVLNEFGSLGGFDRMLSLFNDDEHKIDAQGMYSLLHPLRLSAEFLNREKMKPILKPCVERALAYVNNLEENDLRSSNITSYVVDLIGCVGELGQLLWLSSVEQDELDQARLGFILRLLKSQHFGARMQALKEVSKLLDALVDPKKDRPVISSEKISSWLTDNRVLSVALEGNIDQSQYVDRLKTLLSFLGPRLSCQEVSKIWSLRKGRAAVAVDNVFTILAQAACKFKEPEFDHLIALILKNWSTEETRMKDRILFLLGQVGKETSFVYTHEKVAEVLWTLSHENGLEMPLVISALRAQLGVVNEHSKDGLREIYINKCMEDLTKKKHTMPAMWHLSELLESIKRVSGSSYGYTSAADRKRKMIEDLCNKRDLFDTITGCIVEAQKEAIALAKGAQRCSTPDRTSVDSSGRLSIDTNPSTLLMSAPTITQKVTTLKLESSNFVNPSLTMSDGNDYGAHINGLLKFLSLLLEEGSLQFSWSKVKHIWETLVENPQACDFDRKSCFEWFRNLRDSEICEEAMNKLLIDKLLKLDVTRLTVEGFNCFRRFFDAVNKNKGKLKMFSNSYPPEVEDLDLVGLDFVWETALSCADPEIADQSVRLLIDLSYSLLSQKLKKDAESLHRRFLDECSRRLELCRVTLKGSLIGRLLQDAGKQLSACSVPKISTVPMANHGEKKRSVERLLLIASRYIVMVEEEFQSRRVHPPHGTTFHGHLFSITYTSDIDDHKGTGRLLTHGKETLRSVRERLAGRLKYGDQRKEFDLEFNGNKLDHVKDYMTLEQLEVMPANGGDSVQMAVKRRYGFLSTSSQLEKDALVRELQLPSVVLMSTGTVFDLLYDLAKLDDTAIRTAVRRLLLLIPCDKGVQNAFDGLIASSPKSPQKSNSLDRKKLANSFDKIAGAGRSPKLSARFVKGHSPKPSKTDDFPSPSEPYDTPAERLKKLFDPKEPFRLLYNLEVLSSRLLPVTYNEESFESANRACRDFVSSNGVHVLTDLLRNDHLPPNLELGYRQEIFDRLLSILCYLLCGDSKLHDIVRSEKETDDRLKSEEETASDADTSRRTTSFGAAASSAAGNVGLSLANLEPPRSRLVTEIPVELYAAILASLQRFAWTAAAGMLSFSSQVELRSPNGSIQYAPSPRSRLSESSTGSGDSHDLQGAPTSVHSALLAGHTSPSQIDDDLTRAGLTLLIECILKRPADGPDEFFRLPFVNDFVLDLLLLTPSEQIRYWTEDQLLRMSFEATDGLVGRRLLDLLLKAHLPLWTTSSTVRGASRRLLEQCSEYFSLRSKLMESVPDEDLAALQPSPTQMLDDECNWLLNFNCSTDPRAADTDARLLAGHMQMIEALLKRVPERKAKVGQRLIHALVVEFLFPAAARISPDLQQQSLTPKSQRQARAADVRAKCQKSAGRLAAFRLLQELARGCKTNFSAIAHLLTSLHHESNPELGKQWDYAPLVDGAMDLGYIGLKNAGATCYMNSVLQQFFMEPGVAEYILSTELDDEDNVSRESVFVELQRVFGHLRESELEYYTPKSFWDVFRLWGQKVNPREQQDAFEFYTCLIDQIDTELKKHGREELFKKKYQGIFSDQKICHGCPHRYEREEPFYALNLPLRALGLEESLDQFVTGEILEGENAYLCEKCGQKRTTLKRMCVKSLPPVLTIQLKRFDYDWEEGRSLKFNDHFKFPRSLDMYPYTAQALSAIENVDDLFEMSSPSLPPNNSYGSGLGAGLQGSSLQVAGSPVTPGPFGGGGSNWSARLRRFSSSYGASFDEHSAKYDLVGMVVHSGQASAGHYYAYIKERREDASLNGNFNKWLKFNDTTVEEVEMTDHLLETECFGGRYTVKNDNKMSMYPEERERYWNAYLLIYEKADRTSKGGKSLRHRSSPYSAKRSISVNISGPTPPSNKQARRRDSLSELAALVEQGELTNLFKGGASIPPRLREEIRDENLKFARDRDLFNKDYFKFAAALVDGAIYSKDLDEESAADATKFAVHFCVNLAWHTRKTLRGDALAFSDRICTLLKHSRVACNWIFTEFGQEPGNKFIDDFLFNCDTADARYAFANILKAAFEHGALYLRTDTPQDVRPDRHADDLITHAISLIRKEAADRWAISDAFFGLLHSYAALGPAACQHLLNRGAFRALLGFLVTVPAKNVDGIEKMSRRWTHAQARDFGDVWCALALIITACDLQQFNNTKAVSAVAPPSGVASPERKKLLPSSSDVYDVVVGWMMPGFVKEIVWALANVPNTQDCLTDLVVHAAYGNVNFSRAFLSEALDALADFPSNELRRIFHVVAGLITRVDDAHCASRIEFLLDGPDKESNSIVDGLLAIIQNSQTADSRRTYHCIKFLVNLTEQSTLVKEALTQRLERWQWAVDWLRKKMHDFATGSNSTTNYSPTTSTKREESNEESLNRSFQRTVSAQYTLESAQALMREFSDEQSSSSAVEIECSDENSNQSIELSRVKGSSLSNDE